MESLARLRGEAPRLVLGLSLSHWDGVAFDATVARMAAMERGRQIEQVLKKASKDAGGMDVIATLVAMVAARGGG